MSSRGRTAARLAVAGALLAALVWLELPDPPAGPPLVWRDDLDEALADARAGGRPALLSFHATWCSICRKLDQRTLRDAEVAAELERFERIRVDASGSDRATGDLLARFGVRGLPTLLLVDSSGAPGPRPVLGFVPRERLLDLLREVH